MRKFYLLLLLGMLFCLSSQAEDSQQFCFLMFIDKKIIMDPTELDFILVDTWTNKHDTVKCIYQLSNVRIKSEDLEKIQKADSIYTHIEIQSVVNFHEYKYDIKCYKQFYKLNFYMIEIFNLDKYGTKYDYSYYGQTDRNQISGGVFRKKKNYKYIFKWCNF